MKVVNGVAIKVRENIGACAQGIFLAQPCISVFVTSHSLVAYFFASMREVSRPIETAVRKISTVTYDPYDDGDAFFV